MKNTKRFLTVLMLVALVLVCVFAVSACGKGSGGPHVHTYSKEVTAPNCANEGFTTYTCKICGDSYVSDVVPAESGAHKYETKVSRFPTTLVPGVEKNYCIYCGDSTYDTIDVVSFSLPSVSEAIVKLLGDCHYELEVGEDTTFIYLRELEDYTYAEGTKTSVAIKVANAVIDITDSHLTANLALDFGIATDSVDGEGATPVFSAMFTVNATLDGDALTLEVTENEEPNPDINVDITEAFYSSIAGMLGLSYEQLVEAVYVGGELVSYAPILESMVNIIASIEVTIPVMDLSTVISAIQDKVFVTTEEGKNTRIELDIAALTQLVESLEGKKGAEIIDALYGEGAMAALTEYVKALPNMTVKQIADTAITVAETYGINVDDVYSLVNYVVYVAFGANFDVEGQIIERYNSTLAELVGEMLIMTGTVGQVTEQDIAASINTAIDNILTTISESTLDQLYNMLTGTPDADATVLSDSLKMLVAMLSEMVEMDMLLDSEGNIIEINAKYNVAAPNMESIDMSYAATADGFELTVVAGDYTAAITNTADGTQFAVKYDTATLISGTVVETENGIKITGQGTFNGVTGNVVIEYGDNGFSYVLTVNGETVEEVNATLVDGKLTSLHVESYVLYTYDYGNIIETELDLILLLDYVNTAEEFGIEFVYPPLSLDVSKVGDDISASITAGGFDIEFEATVNESGIVASIDIGNYDGESISASLAISADGIDVDFTVIDDNDFKCEGDIVLDETQLKAEIDVYDWDYENEAYALEVEIFALVNQDGITASVTEKETDWFSLEVEFTETGFVAEMLITVEEYDYMTESYFTVPYVIEASLENGVLSIVVKEDNKLLADLDGTFGLDENGIAIELDGEILLEEYDYETYEYVGVMVPFEYEYVVRTDRIAEKTMVDGEGYGYEVVITESGLEFSYVMNAYDYEDDEIKTSELVGTLENGILDCELKFDGEVIGEINGDFNDGVSLDALIKDSFSEEIVVDFNLEITEEETADGVVTTITFDTGKLLIESGMEEVDYEYYEWVDSYITAIGSIIITRS